MILVLVEEVLYRFPSSYLYIHLQKAVDPVVEISALLLKPASISE